VFTVAPSLHDLLTLLSMVAIAFWFGFLSAAYWWQARARYFAQPADPAEMEPRAAPAEK
jgi:hypothetical protein